MAIEIFFDDCEYINEESNRERASFTRGAHGDMVPDSARVKVKERYRDSGARA